MQKKAAQQVRSHGDSTGLPSLHRFGPAAGTRRFRLFFKGYKAKSNSSSGGRGPRRLTFLPRCKKVSKETRPAPCPAGPLRSADICRADKNLLRFGPLSACFGKRPHRSGIVTWGLEMVERYGGA